VQDLESGGARHLKENIQQAAIHATISSIMTKQDQTILHYRRAVGRFNASNGVKQDIFGISKSQAYYYTRKFQDPSFHNGTAGGARNVKFSDEDKFKLHCILWQEAKRHPTNSIDKYRRKVKKSGFDVSRSYLCRLFKKWRWSFKRPSVKQIAKYTRNNILYYGDFLSGIKNIPWGKLKYLDECHFKRGDLHNRQSLGRIGERAQILDTGSLHESLSMTLMTTLSGQYPIHFDLRDATNNQYNFLSFLCSMVENGHLKSGDVLICDNATVHVGNETTDAVYNLLDAAQVKLFFLPTYSPELNPAELVFALLKQKVRAMRKQDIPLWLLVLTATQDVLWRHMVAFYRSCVNGSQI